MTKINIEEWFSSPKRWEREHGKRTIVRTIN